VGGGKSLPTCNMREGHAAGGGGKKGGRCTGRRRPRRTLPGGNFRRVEWDEGGGDGGSGSKTDTPVTTHGNETAGATGDKENSVGRWPRKEETTSAVRKSLLHRDGKEKKVGKFSMSWPSKAILKDEETRGDS